LERRSTLGTLHENGSNSGISTPPQSRSAHPHVKIKTRELVGQSILLLVLLSVLFSGVFLEGDLIVPGDLLFNYPPWESTKPTDLQIENEFYFLDALNAINKYYYLANRSLDRGEWPLWNDLEMGGLPLLANGQTALFYPPRLLHRAMDPFVATTFYILLKLFLCGIGAYVAARVLGIGHIGSRIVSVGWMLCGYNVVWCHWPLPDISAWLPFLIAACELIVQRRYRSGFFGMAATASMLLLAGHPETAFSGSLWIGLYFFLRVLWQRFHGQPLAKPLAVAAAAWCVALLVSAVQVLPLVEYILNSDRVMAGQWMRGSGHIEWGDLYGFWLPNLFASSEGDRLGILWVAWLFIGVTAWLGIATLFVRPQGTDARVVCLGICSALSALLIFPNPLTDVLVLPPIIGSMMQKYHLVFLLFALLLMSGIGIERWLSQRQSMRGNAALVAIALIGCVFAFAYYWPMRPSLIVNETNATAVRQLVISAATITLGLALLVLNSFWHRPKWIGLGLAFVLAAELIVSLRPFHHPVPREALFVDTELTRYLQALEGPVRIDLNGAKVMWPGLLTYYGVETLGGYDGLYPNRTIATFLGRNPYRPAMRPALSITHTLDRPEHSDDPDTSNDDARESRVLLNTLNGVEVYRNEDSLPRVYLAPNLEVMPYDDFLKMGMMNPDFDPRTRTLTLDDPPNRPSATSEPLGSAEIVARTPNSVTVAVIANAPCTLILSENNYPGWRVAIDGESAQLLTVFGCLRGVIVGEGDQIVRFDYRPQCVRIGLLISSVALLFGLVAGVLMGYRIRFATP